MFFWLKRILNLFYNFHDSRILCMELIKWSCKKCKSLLYSKLETYVFRRSTSNISCYYFSRWKSRDDVGIVLLSRSNNIVNDTFNIYQVLIANWSTGLSLAYLYSYGEVRNFGLIWQKKSKTVFYSHYSIKWNCT